MKSTSILAAIAALAVTGCAQHWADTSGAHRGFAELKVDSDRCMMAAFGTQDPKRIVDQAYEDNNDAIGAGFQIDRQREQYASCVQRAGWAVRDGPAPPEMKAKS